MLDRITFADEILGGRACVRGLRIPVALLINLLGNGMAPADILEEYPDLEEEDLSQALAYGAALSDEEFDPFTPTAA